MLVSGFTAPSDFTSLSNNPQQYDNVQRASQRSDNDNTRNSNGFFGRLQTSPQRNDYDNSKNSNGLFGGFFGSINSFNPFKINPQPLTFSRPSSLLSNIFGTNTSPYFSLSRINEPNQQEVQKQPVTPNSISNLQYRPVQQFSQVTPAYNNYYNLQTQCGVPQRQLQDFTSLVVNGIPAFKGQFPWIAAMFHNGVRENGFICGGSLVTSRSIITAAHCIQNKNDFRKRTEEVIFYIGKFFINSFTNEKDFIVAPVSRIVLHPDWNPRGTSYDGDIAIATLSRVVQFTQFIQPICLWTYSNNYYDIINQHGVVAGYGKTHLSPAISDKPYWTALPIVDEATCLRSKDEFSKIVSRRTFCVGSRDGSGPCNGKVFFKTILDIFKLLLISR